MVYQGAWRAASRFLLNKGHENVPSRERNTGGGLKFEVCLVGVVK